MKKKISPEVKEIITHSKREAKIKYNYFGTEHLLLALLNQKDSRVIKILTSLNIDIQALKLLVDTHITALLRQSDASSSAKTSFLGMHTDKIIETSYIEAYMFKAPQVAPEHLFLRILKYGTCTAAKILRSLDIHYLLCSDKLALMEIQEADKKNVTAEKYQSQTNDTLDISQYLTEITKHIHETRKYATVEREAEIQEIAQILRKRDNSSVLLIGESGVGKRAIVNEFAHRIQNSIMYSRHYDRILELDWTALWAGTSNRGDIEKRIKAILNELARSPRTILLFNQTQIMFETFNRTGLKITDIFKPALKFRQLKFIGLITPDRYPSLMVHRAMSQHFRQLFIQAPLPQHAAKMLESAKAEYEQFHNVTYEKEAIEACVQLTHLRGEVLPGKAIDLLDEIAAQVRINNMSFPEHIIELREEIKTVKDKSIEALKLKKVEEAEKLELSEIKLRQALQAEEAEWMKELDSKHFIIKKQDVKKAFQTIKKFRQP